MGRLSPRARARLCLYSIYVRGDDNTQYDVRIRSYARARARYVCVRVHATRRR